MNMRSAYLRLPQQHARSGVAMIYVLIMLTLIFAIASFAIDYGRVQLSKSQLQISTDSAARYAALVVSRGKSAVVARANAAAADNKVNGVSPTFSSSDIVLGTWNAKTRVFSANVTPFNAVKISGTQVIPLMLGNVIHKPSITVHVSAVARTDSIGGVIGLNGINIKNNAFIGSYDSSVNPNPTPATASSNAQISSNGAIVLEQNGTLKGSVTMGPSGSLSAPTWTISGQTTKQSAAVAAPSMPTWNPTANPGSITNGDYVYNGGTLNGGTYWFNSLTISAPLTFNGAATIYVNGNIIMQGSSDSITAFNSRPSNLKIYQLGTGRKFDVSNNASIKAVLVAPGSAFNAMNGVKMYGLAVFDTLTFKNNIEIYFDESAVIDAVAALVQ